MDIDFENEKVILEENGKTRECDILFTFDCEDTKKSYIGYTDHSIASNGRKNIFVSAYNPLSNKTDFENITDPKEIEMIADVLEKLDNEYSG